MKLKALSPLIATILLIVVSVILVSIVLSFGQSFTAQGLDKTKDIKELSQSDAEHFVYPKTFSNGTIQFNYSPPNNSFGDVQITKYKIIYDNNETEEIELTTPYTLSTGTNLLNLEDFSDQNISTKKFTIILETEDDKYITLRNITNPFPYVEPEPEPCSLIPEDGEIYYLEHLAYIDTNEATLGGNYILTRDLDFDDDASYCQPETYKTTWTDGNGWDPIGSSFPSFTGSFDGDNYAISNLYINRPTTDYVGLFGYINTNNNIYDLDLEDVNVIGRNYVGALIGRMMTGNGDVYNCSSSGEVTGTDYVGGLIGESYNGDPLITKCYSTANVSGNSLVGGFIGFLRISTVTNSYSTGSVSTSGAAYSVAGFGTTEMATITNCYSKGLVTGTNASGFVHDYDYGTVNNSYWDINTSGKSTSSLGTGKTTTQMKQQATFTDWNFSTIWAIDEGTSYPYLQWQD
jgi:hypothetical protein